MQYGYFLLAQFQLQAALDRANAILNGDNNCSGWLDGSARDFMYPGLQGDFFQHPAAAMFQSDSFELNNNASFTGEVGNSSQGSGWYSSITINLNSPWTVSSVPAGLSGSLGQHTGAAFMQGPALDSTSVFGQTTAVFHEFAHTINAVPPDGGNPPQSSINTGTVLSNCGSAITGR